MLFASLVRLPSALYIHEPKLVVKLVFLGQILARDPSSGGSAVKCLRGVGGRGCLDHSDEVR